MTPTHYIEERLKEFEEELCEKKGELLYLRNWNTHNENLIPTANEIKSFLKDSLEQAYETGKKQGSLQAFEILHKHAMKTTDIKTLDLLEEIQREIISETDKQSKEV